MKRRSFDGNIHIDLVKQTTSGEQQCDDVDLTCYETLQLITGDHFISRPDAASLQLIVNDEDFDETSSNFLDIPLSLMFAHDEGKIYSFWSNDDASESKNDSDYSSVSLLQEATYQRIYTENPVSESEVPTSRPASPENLNQALDTICSRDLSSVGVGAKRQRHASSETDCGSDGCPVGDVSAREFEQEVPMIRASQSHAEIQQHQLQREDNDSDKGCKESALDQLNASGSNSSVLAVASDNSVIAPSGSDENDENSERRVLYSCSEFLTDQRVPNRHIEE